MNRREALKLALGAGAYSMLPLALANMVVNSDTSDSEFTDLCSRIETILQRVMFEPNDEITREHVIAMVSNLLEYNTEISDFNVICNAKNNTSEVVDQNQLRVDVYFKVPNSNVFNYIPIIFGQSNG